MENPIWFNLTKKTFSWVTNIAILILLACEFKDDALI
jgi:hypothetical protein